MKKEFAVEFSQVSVTIGGKERVAGLTFGVGRGEFVVFVGPNGAHKSLLLELCCGVVSSSHGVVKTLGVDWASANQAEQDEVRQRVGSVFQKPALMKGMTVFDNVALPLRYHTFLDEDIVQEKVLAQLLDVNLMHHRDTFPEELTTGESKFAALARARVLNQELILIDDPLTGLDEEEVIRLTSMFERYQGEGGITIIAMINAPSRLLQMADRVALVWDGRIIEMGVLTEVYENVDEERMKAYVTWEVA
jgi:ABC-type transporter Mla maintaining outer membrane lipid asymmetry ATPase subunit MlaF